MASIGATVSSVYFLFPQTVTQRLIQKKYEILSTDPSNNHHWKAILSSYKGAKFHKRDLKLANFNPNGEENEKIKELQKICKDLTKEFLTNDRNNYRRAAKWCVVPVTARKILSRRGVKALGETDADFKWQAKIMKYRINKDSRKKDDKLDAEILKNEGIDKLKIESLKLRCKELGNTFNYQHPSHHARDIFEAWCSDT